MNSATSSNFVIVGKSLATIAALDYLGPVLARSIYGITGEWTVLLVKALVSYLKFAAYDQKFISIPQTSVLAV